MTERMFTVLVPRDFEPSLAYPEQTGDKALATMMSLKARGYQPIARTTGNGITSDLTIVEMESIYDPGFCQQLITERHSA